MGSVVPTPLGFLEVKKELILSGSSKFDHAIFGKDVINLFLDQIAQSDPEAFHPNALGSGSLPPQGLGDGSASQCAPASSACLLSRAWGRWKPFGDLVKDAIANKLFGLLWMPHSGKKIVKCAACGVFLTPLVKAGEVTLASLQRKRS
jgi:hypothetical protein